MQEIPGLFQFLLQENCISHRDIITTPDGLSAIFQPLSGILAEKGITQFPGSEGQLLACDRFFDDWYLYALPHEQAAVYGLFKLREQEQDAREGIPADGDTPGVTISFIALREVLLHTCLTTPTQENCRQLGAEINRVVAYSGQRHHRVMKQYFKNPKAQGAYLVAELYVQKIASLARDGYMETPIAYRAKTRQAQLAEALNQAAGRIICDGEKLYIADKNHPTELESAAILLTHTGNTSVYSFAAEVEYHARFLTPLARLRIPFLGKSPYASAVRADMSIADTEFEGPAPYRRENSRIVRRQRRLHPRPTKQLI